MFVTRDRGKTSSRKCSHRRKLVLEALETRKLLAADLVITNAFLVDANNNPISAPVEGEIAIVRAEWLTTDLNASQQYQVHFEMDGITVASATITGQAGVNLPFNWYRPVAFSAPGTRQVRVIVDGSNSVSESNEGNNEFIFNYTPLRTNLPEKFVFPIGGEAQVDWSVVNYTDVNRNDGAAIDFKGGPYQYDGHDALDITLPSFQRMDEGVPIFAAASGVVIAAVDGNFDRETASNNNLSNYVAIDHGNGWVAYYFHLLRDTVSVQIGQSVTSGQTVGLAGSSGSSTDAHLHFSLYRNGSLVEPMYKPQDYFIDAPVYQGELPPGVTASGISDRNPWSDLKEGPNDIRKFRTDGTADTWFWYRLTHLDNGQSLAIEWYRPDNTLDATYNWTASGVARYNGHVWVRNTRSHVGTWTVVVKHAGNVLASETFEVIVAGGSPEIDVRTGGSYVIDGRSTPIDFGSASSGSAAVVKTFDISNWGTDTLTISSIDTPDGFAVTTPLPINLVAGGTTVINTQLTTTKVGSKRGELVLHTNDSDEALFSIEVEGIVTGSLPAGAATLAQNLPALAIEDHFRHAVFGNAVLGNVVGLDLSNGKVVADVVSGKQLSDRLSLNSSAITVSQGQVLYLNNPIANVVEDGSSGRIELALLATTTVAAVTEILAAIQFMDEATTPVSRRRMVEVYVENSAMNQSNPLRRGVVYSDNLALLPSLSINDVTVTEGNSGTVNAVFTVTLSAASGQAVSVNYATANSTAVVPADYLAGSGTLNFAAGETTKTITVVVNGDLLDEINEAFFVNLTAPTNATLVDAQGQGTITDNDPSPTLAINDMTVTEGNAGSVNAIFTVTMSAASGQTVIVNYDTGNNIAVAPGDYTNTSGTLTFAPGETSKTVAVPVIGDLLDEANETFFVNLTAPVNASLADGQGIGTITDDDATPTLTINDVTVTEGSAGSVNATFTVTLSAASGRAISVNFATADDVADSPADFVSNSGTLNFSPDETSKTINVIVASDSLDEVNETFNVNLTAATNASIAKGLGVGTITDDDAPPTVTLSRDNATIAEAAGTSVMTATLSAVSSLPVTIVLGFSGTATPLDDFAPSATQIVIPAGQTTGSVTLTAVQDTLDEVDETIIVDITNVTNATEATPQQATVTITDDDAPLDFGDAPTTYPITLAQNGARHSVGPVFLGASIDDETDGTPSAAANADGADDGVTLIASLFKVNGAASRSSFRIVASQVAKLDGWIDFNADGDWNDAGEQVFTSVNVAAGVNILNFTVPASATIGNTFARFRLSTAGALAPTGAVANGEVEDYLQTIIDGDSSAGVTITIVNGTIRLTRDSGDNVVRSGATELFRALAASIESLQVNGTATDDTVTIDFASGFTIPTGGLQIEGGGGRNSLVLEGAGALDLTDSDNIIANLNSIDLQSSTPQTITVDRNAINQLSPAAKSIRVLSSSNDTIEVGDLANWRMTAPKVEGSTFVLTAQNRLGGSEIIEVAGGRPFTNFLQAGDVNNSGTVSAGDALEVIFELNRRLVSSAIGDLVDPTTVTPWPGFYQDVNIDGRVTAADALAVINILFLQSLGSGEGELPAPVSLDLIDRNEEPASIDFPVADPETLAPVKKISAQITAESPHAPNHAVIDDIMSDWEDTDESNSDFGLSVRLRF